MRIFVIRTHRLAAPAALMMSFAVLIALAALLPARGGVGAVSVKNAFGRLDTNEKRVALLESYGLFVENAPREIVQVTIPRRFDAVYEAYNDLQKPLGLDLRRYRGKTAIRYTYVVTNAQEAEGTVFANLLVLEDALIGADLSSADPTGFARPLSGGV